MELYIGGYKQGKLNYVLNIRNKAPEEVKNDFHLWVRQLLEEHEDAEAVVEAYINEHPDCVIISDEIGNGIVPMDAFERSYRDQLGRILTNLAQRADRVERVICGIGQRIK